MRCDDLQQQRAPQRKSRGEHGNALKSTRTSQQQVVGREGGAPLVRHHHPDTRKGKQGRCVDAAGLHGQLLRGLACGSRRQASSAVRKTEAQHAHVASSRIRRNSGRSDGRRMAATRTWRWSWHGQPEQRSGTVSRPHQQGTEGRHVTGLDRDHRTPNRCQQGLPTPAATPLLGTTIHGHTDTHGHTRTHTDTHGHTRTHTHTCKRQPNA